MKRKSKKPEKVAEKQFVHKVEAKGWEAIKLSMFFGFGRRGRTDRLVLAPWRVVALFEFKREGEKARPLQRYMHKKYRKLGIPCYVVYTCEQAWEILQKEIEEAKEVHTARLPA